jgi:hypothetical protein
MWGTFGGSITTSLISAKVKQYQSRYKPEYINKLKTFAGGNTRGVDCVGLIKSYLFCQGETYKPGEQPKYNGCFDQNVSGFWAACKKRGMFSNGKSTVYSFAPIKSNSSGLPDAPAGTLVFYGSTHVGIYLGDGKTIEAPGSSLVGIRAFTARAWTAWGLLDWIDYSK